MVPQSGLRILPVEDDPDAQANMRDILELDGHRVDVAGSISAEYAVRRRTLRTLPVGA